MYYINNNPECQHVIYCGDCLDVMAALPAESIDIVVTSPPYNIGIKYGSYKDTLSNDEYLEWINKVAMG